MWDLIVSVPDHYLFFYFKNMEFGIQFSVIIPHRFIGWAITPDQIVVMVL